MQAPTRYAERKVLGRLAAAASAGRARERADGARRARVTSATSDGGQLGAICARPRELRDGCACFQAAGRARAEALTGRAERPADRVPQTGGHTASALAGAHEGETSLMGLATGDEASALAEAGPVETSAAGLATVGNEASALAGAHEGETSLAGLAAGDEASALAVERPVARADPQ
ncbi:hypothetical protein T492DRAFT_880143 [Pavlovales sp. CCMP2436]|nr:hypothetical protein T492DRAFT_880143 [Pavlovales sp. CCMP2436]